MPLKPPPEGLQPLRIVRTAKSLTQVELATLIGSRNEWISRWETGDKIPDGLEVRALCKVLKCEPSDLFSAHILAEVERRGDVVRQRRKVVARW